jgi:ABC-type Mn2+/Zn2+ transport system ATPase subunit
MTVSDPHIVVEKLVKTYGDRTVLHGVDLTIDRAQTLVIIGGSGAGKSTLVRHLIALERPTSGPHRDRRHRHRSARRRRPVEGPSPLRDGLSEIRPLRLHDLLRQRRLPAARADEAAQREGGARQAP